MSIILHSFELRKMLMSLMIIFLIYFPNLHALNCYSTGRFYFSREDFHWENIVNHINHHSIISNSSTCHVRITIDYNNKKNHYVVIKFQPIENLTHTNIEFGSTINFHSNNIQPTIISYLDYQCSSGNLCDKYFLKQWPKEYLDHPNNSLHRNLLSLWKNSMKCDEKYRTSSCESYVCFTIYNELKNLSYGRSQCNEPLLTNPVNIHIKTKSGNSRQEYQCQKNQCTGELIYNSLIEKNSTGKFRMKITDEQMIFKRAIIITGGLLIIGSIAYLIQCRKYKQGYRLARTV